MAKLFTREQARQFLKDNEIKDAGSLKEALIAQFKDLLQEALEAELDHELGYSKYDWKNKEGENSRNGHSKKTVMTEFGKTELDIPRDTNGEFEPVIVKKHERSISPSVNDMIISMYAKGMSTRDIHAHMQRIYGLDVSAEMVSRITDKVIPKAKEWQNRPLDPMYPFLYLDGMVFNVVQDGVVSKKTAYVIYAITTAGLKDVLGIWIGEHESSKYWMSVLTDLKNRGVEDILIASIDGLNGFEEAIKAAFPKTEIQRCIVHQIRSCCKFVSYKDRKQLCADMKEIYGAVNENDAAVALDVFDDKWGKKYPYAVKSWRTHWDSLSTFFKYPPEIRRIMYTTNPIESFNRVVRKITKTKSAFPTDDALLKLMYLVVMDISEKWTMPIHHWGEAIGQLNIYFGDRIAKHL
jgi:putative transposase